MPAGRPTRCVATEPAQTAPRATCALRDVSEAYVSVGFHVPSARHPDLAALDVAAILLGQSESARLPRLVRDRDQLATSAYANVHALRDPGLLVRQRHGAAGDGPQDRRRARRSQPRARRRALDRRARQGADRRGVRLRATARDRAGPRALARLARHRRRRPAVRARLSRSHPRRPQARRRRGDAPLPAPRQRERRRDPAHAPREGPHRVRARGREARAQRPRHHARAGAARREARRAAERDDRARAPRSVGAGRRDARGVARRPARRGRRARGRVDAARPDADARLRQARRDRTSPIGSTVSAVRSPASPAATASGSPPSGSRAAGSPGSISLADCILDPTLPTGELDARTPPLARRPDRAGRQPDAGRVPGVQRGALRRSPVRPRRARHAGLRRWSLARRPPRVLSRPLSRLRLDARDRRRRRDRRGARRRQGPVRRVPKAKAATLAVKPPVGRRTQREPSARSIATSIARRLTS